MPKFTLTSPEVRLVIQRHVRDYFFDDRPLTKKEVAGPYQAQFVGLPICDAYNSNMQMKSILYRYEQLQKRFANGWESLAQAIDDIDGEFARVTEREVITTYIRNAQSWELPDEICPTIGTYMLQKRSLTHMRPDFIPLAVNFKKVVGKSPELLQDDERYWYEALDLLLFEYIPDEADYTQLSPEQMRARMLEAKTTFS